MHAQRDQVHVYLGEKVVREKEYLSAMVVFRGESVSR
jgi:hypothetical protein